MVFPDGWLNYKEITIQNAEVAGDLTDFPAVYSETDTDLTKARADGFDFVVTESDGTTVVPYERVFWDDATGELIIWIKTDPLGASNVTYRLYYNNSSETTDQQDRDAVWTNGYVAVWHMNQANTVDSTGNGHTGTNDGTIDIAGKIGRARDFDAASSNKIDVADASDLSFGNGSTDVPFSLSAWIKQDSGNSGGVISKATGSTPYDDGEWYVYGVSARYYCSCIDDSASKSIRDTTDSRASPTTDWRHVAFTYDGSGYPATTSTMKTFEDGIDIASSINPNSSDYVAMENTTYPVRIGARGGTNYFAGIIDEVRIHDVERSANWVSTEYDNQNTPSTWWSTGSEINVTAFELVGKTQDIDNVNTNGFRCVLIKSDGAAQASRVYTVTDHVNSAGAGDYTFASVGDDDPQYMVYINKLDTPPIRGVSNDTLEPVEE